MADEDLDENNEQKDIDEQEASTDNTSGADDANAEDFFGGDMDMFFSTEFNELHSGEGKAHSDLQNIDNVDELFQDEFNGMDDLFDEPKADGENKEPKKKNKEEGEEEDGKPSFEERINKLKEKAENTKQKVITFFKELTLKQAIKILKWVVFALIVIIGIASIFIGIGVFRNKNGASIHIAQPKNAVNSASYIYVDSEFKLDGEKHKIKKLLIDSAATIFYFDSPIDLDKYEPLLIDNLGHRYYLDVSAAANNTNADNLTDTIEFQGLDLGVTKFRLTLDEIEEKDEESIYFIDFVLDEPVVKTPEKYAYSDEDLLQAIPEIDFNIVEGEFSAVKSTVGILGFKNSKSPLAYDKEYFVENFYIKEGINELKIIPEEIDVVEFEDEKAIVAELSFEKLKSLGSKITIGLRNVIYRYELNRKLDLNALLLDKKTPDNAIDLGKHTLSFEGAKKYSDLVVLVAHSVDKEYESPKATVAEGTDEYGRPTEIVIPPKEEEKEPDRVETIIDAELVLTQADGKKVTIKGEPKHTRIGTDILFKQEGIGKYSSRNMVLTVKTVDIKGEGGEIEIDLSKQPNVQKEGSTANVKFIEDNFNDRLKYKSGELVLSQVTGFSDKVINDKKMQEIYRPKNVEARSSYAVEVDTFAEYEGEFLCIVSEEWTGVENGERVMYRAKHKVKLIEGYGEKLIIEDEIIDIK